MSADVLFGSLESSYGLPPGVLDAIWAQESSRGQNMFNPESGAKGHFQMIPQNYMHAGIDPMNLYQSASWTARNAADALRRFPGLDPIAAIAAQHFGGPNTALWGPKTRGYVGSIYSRMGRESDMFTPPPASPMSMPTIPTSAPAPAPAPMPQQAAPLDMRTLLSTPGFFADVAAGMDPQALPMQALAAGLSNAYTRADERRAAFEGKMNEQRALAQQQRQMEQAQLWKQYDAAQQRAFQRERLGQKQQELSANLAWEREKLGLQQMADLEKMEKGLKTPAKVQEYKYFEKIFGKDIARAMVAPGGLTPDELKERAEAQYWGGRRGPFIEQKSEELSAARDILSETQRLLADFERGEFTGKTGPVRGHITQYFDPKVAELQAKSLTATLQQLTQAQLAPVSNYEIALLQRLYASETRNEAQNIAILRELRRIQAKKVQSLNEVIERLRAKENLESIRLNPPDLDFNIPTGTGGQQRSSTEPVTRSRRQEIWEELLEGF